MLIRGEDELPRQASTHLKYLRSIHREGSIPRQGLVDLTHDGDHCWVKSRVARADHIPVRCALQILFLLVHIQKLVKLSITLIPPNLVQRSLCIIPTTVIDEPPR